MGLQSKIMRSIRHRRQRRALARRLDRDPTAVAQILLLFRMMLVDGVVREQEMRVFGEICTAHFGVAADEIHALHSYLERRQARSDGDARETLLRSISMEERLRLIRLMGLIAKAGHSTAPGEAGNGRSEQRLIRETAVSLGVVDDSAGEGAEDPVEAHPVRRRIQGRP